MAFIASLPRACATSHLTEKQKNPTSQTGYSNNSSLGIKKAVKLVSLDIEGYEKTTLIGGRTEDSAVMFSDGRWKKGTWDLNMFVKNGRMDWDGVIVAEAKRRKFLEKFPAASSIEEPVMFRSSIIPWWAWVTRSLPEAELLNGRAAMVGFFMAYLIDAMTGLDLVGQTGNIMCKAGLFLTVLGVILFRRQGDFENLKKLTDEATFYDKQWRASWEDQEPGQR